MKHQLNGKFAEMRAKLDVAGYHVIPGLHNLRTRHKRENTVWLSGDCLSHHAEFLKYVHGLFDHVQKLTTTTEQIVNKNLPEDQERTWSVFTIVVDEIAE